MGQWGYLILFFVCAWILQIIFTLIQNRHYSQTIRELSERYSPGYLGVGVVKQRFGVGSVVILVSDLSGKIVAAKEMTGVTVFSRFRPISNLIGESVQRLSQTSGEDHRTRAIRMAAEQIMKEQEKKKEQGQNVSRTLAEQA